MQSVASKCVHVRKKNGLINWLSNVDNSYIMHTLSLVGKSSRRAHVGCGIRARSSGSSPYTSTKLQLGLKPRLVINFNEM